MAKIKPKKNIRKKMKTSRKSGKSKLNSTDLSRFIEKTAREAGKIIKKDFRHLSIKNIGYKGGNVTDLVTSTDRKSEHLILSRLWELATKYNQNFLVKAEESGDILIIGKKNKKKTKKPDLIWHVDPIDGTMNYTFGIPFFAVSIAAEKNGKIIAGVVYDPIKNEMFLANDGKSYLNGKRLDMNKKKLTKFNLINMSLSRKKENFGMFTKIIRKYRVAVRACASLNMCQVAVGRADGSILFTPKSWDVAAAVAIVEGAGGIVTDLKGKKWIPKDMPAVAATVKLNKELVKTLNGK